MGERSTDGSGKQHTKAAEVEKQEMLDDEMTKSKRREPERKLRGGHGPIPSHTPR